jgi:hypothetical protein
LQPYSIQEDRYVDTGRGCPAAVRILVLDARDDDLAHLVSQNGLSPDTPVVEAVSGSWGGAELPAHSRPPGSQRLLGQLRGTGRFASAKTEEPVTSATSGKFL